MKTLNIIKMTAFVAIMLQTLSAMAQDISLKGKWKIDISKSDFHGAPAYTLSKDLRIDESVGNIIISRTGEDDMGQDSISVETVSVGGKAARLKNSDGVIKEFTLQLSSAEKTLTESFTYIDSDGDIRFSGMETMKLSDDGQALLITRYVKGTADFEYTVQGYYVRVK